jgi:hypothetical protein
VNAVTIERAMSDARVEAMVVVPELLRLMLRGIERRGARAPGRAGRSAMRRPYLPFALRRALRAGPARARRIY